MPPATCNAPLLELKLCAVEEIIKELSIEVNVSETLNLTVLPFGVKLTIPVFSNCNDKESFPVKNDILPEVLLPE